MTRLMDCTVLIRLLELLSVVLRDISPNRTFRITLPLQYFANFFRHHINNLDNSFIFVLGDHGLRFGGIRSTPVGLLEDNNPLLMVRFHVCY